MPCARERCGWSTFQFFLPMKSADGIAHRNENPSVGLNSAAITSSDSAFRVPSKRMLCHAVGEVMFA